MIRRLSITSFFALILVFGMNIHAEDKVYFSHITSAEGLSHNAVTCTMTDSRGFLWIGTYNGLNRYDGSNFRIFYKDAIGSRSDFISAIHEDGEGNIWIGTDNSLFKYDPGTETFTEICPEMFGGHRILRIEPGRDNSILVNMADRGLIRYSGDGKASCIYEDSILCMAVSSEPGGVLWACSTGKGLWYSVNNGARTPFRPDIFGNCKFTDIVFDKDGTMYLSDDRLGLYTISPDRSQVRHILDMPLLTDIEICGEYVFVASYSGLVRYSRENGGIEIFSSRTDDDFSISENEITCISSDSFGNVYLGGYGGINIIRPGTSVFEKYYLCSGENLKHQLVRCFIENEDGSITVISKTAGALKFNPRSKSLKRDPRKFPDQIYSAIKDGRSLFISTSLGIWKQEGGRMESIPCHTFTGDDETSDRFFNLLRTSSSEIYASHRKALLKYNGDSFEHIPSFDGIFADDLKEDSSGKVWISTYEAGLFICGENGKILRNFSQDGTGADYIPGNKVMCSFEDSAGRIWISIYNSGLYCMEDPETGFQLYPVEFRECKVIYDIFEDRSGGLWLTTGNGLIRIDMDTRAQHLYTTDDGLLNNSFEYSSHLVASDSTVYIGSSDGFIRFSPADMGKDAEITSIVFTDFMINGERIIPGKASPLKESISCTDCIYLKAKQNNISFSVYAVSSRNSGKRLHYILEGYENFWHICSAEDKITYSHLHPGQYLLHVRGISGDGKASETCGEIKIVIRRPILATGPAWVVYAILVTGIGAGIYLRFEYKRRKRKKYYQLVIDRAVARARREAIEETERRMLQERNAAESKEGESVQINAKDRKFIDSLNEVILKNLEDFEFSSGSLARDIGMSTSTLSRRVQEVFGTSPNDYIRQTRLNTAALLIREGSLSIKEIGYKVGFGTPSYFIKCFKAQFGCLPSEYKKNG